MASGVPMSRLRWHYRSAHESLITFSNVSFYDGDLHTFPSVDRVNPRRGLHFEHVADGVYEGSGLNLVEARRVADAVAKHVRETPELSLGVGTFNLRQQIAIQDELEARRRHDATLDAFLAPREVEPFFVKNLENIQGDERDVIFLSVTYGKGPDGRIRYNFGPVNGQNGWRRLNVLTSRAKICMRVFSSMRGDDINPASSTSGGPALLRSFLTYAERGQLDGLSVSAAAETESPFEREVFNELTRRGLRLQPQVGVTGYRIDFGVLDDTIEGRFVCGIECDGVAYHASETARDRDRLRQQVLEMRGWTIHRIWSTDWFKDRPGQIDRILRLVEVSRVKARTGGDRPPVPSVEREEPQSRPAIGPLRMSPTPPAIVLLKAARYAKAADHQKFSGNLHEEPTGTIANEIVSVVSVESPVHIQDVSNRVIALWGLARAGSRIMEKIYEARDLAKDRKRIEVRGEFLWSVPAAFKVRSREGTGIPAERIAPEEYREAVVMCLKGHGVVPRKDLVTSVRALLGFNRTGVKLDGAIDGAIQELMQAGEVGEGSEGLRLR